MAARHIGVDLALTTAHKAVVLEDQHKLKTLPVPMEREGFEDFLKAATSGASGPCHFVLEPTGNVWPLLGALLRERGHQVSLVTGHKTAGARKSFNRHCKTDVTDGEAIARVAIMDPERGTYPMPDLNDGRLQLKRLVSQREQLVGDATRFKLRIIAACQGASPHLAQALGSDKFSTANRVFLRHFLDPFETKRLGMDGLAKGMVEKGARRLSTERLESLFVAAGKAADILEQLRASGHLPLSLAQLSDEVNDALDILDFLEKKIKLLDKRIDVAYLAIDPSRALLSMPGFGDLTAATIEAHLGAVDRFRNIRAFVSFCGLAPRRRQTGKSTGTKGLAITKAGQSSIRRLLYLAARRAIKSDPEIFHCYDRLRARGLHHNKVMIALAHKLARRAFALLKRRARGAASFELRTPDGRVVDPGEAMQFIRERTANSEEASSEKAVVPPPAESRPAERVSDRSGQSLDSTTPHTSPEPVHASLLVHRLLAKTTNAPSAQLFRSGAQNNATPVREPVRVPTESATRPSRPPASTSTPARIDLRAPIHRSVDNPPEKPWTVPTKNLGPTP